MTSQPRAITDGPVPKRDQLVAILRRRIAEELGPDLPIPSERELVEEHQVSRMTVREAIGQLVQDGLVHRVHGKGTFVSAPQVESQMHLASFSADTVRRGLVPSTQVLATTCQAPPAAIAKGLGLADGERTWVVERVRLADGTPMAHETSWFPERLFPGLLDHDLSGSIYTILDEVYRLAPTAGEQVLTAESASRSTAALLHTAPGAALLLFDRTTRSGDVVVEHTTSRYRADRYSLRTSLDRNPGSQG